MHATPAGSVSEQWGRIDRWLRANLADVAYAGAGTDDIESAAQSTGVLWAGDLVELFGLISGFSVDHYVSVLPQHELFDLQRVVDERAMELEVWSEFDEEMGAPDPDSEAGNVTGTYHPAFVPFAGMDGYLLVVDTRPGPLHGCVTEFEKVDADGGGPRWVSLGAMLTDLADSLESGGEFDGGWFPSVVDGRLEWEYGPEA